MSSTSITSSSQNPDLTKKSTKAPRRVFIRREAPVKTKSGAEEDMNPKKQTTPISSIPKYPEESRSNLEVACVKHELKLEKKQHRILSELFAGPNLLLSLMKAHPTPIETKSEILQFLLLNRCKLDAYISPEGRNRSVEMLTSLLQRWSESTPDSVAIDFEEMHLYPDQTFRLPVDGLSRVAIKKPLQLMKERKGRICETRCSVYEESGHFFVSLELHHKGSVRNEPKKSNATPQPTKTQRSRTDRAPEIVLKPGQRLPYIVRTSPEPRRARVLYSPNFFASKSGMKTMNWSGLSGWGVQGGLPSLGRRAR